MDHRHEPGVAEFVQYHRRYGGYGGDDSRAIGFIRWSPVWDRVGYSPQAQYSGQRAEIIAWDDPVI